MVYRFLNGFRMCCFLGAMAHHFAILKFKIFKIYQFGSLNWSAKNEFLLLDIAWPDLVVPPALIF